MTMLAGYCTLAKRSFAGKFSAVVAILFLFSSQAALAATEPILKKDYLVTYFMDRLPPDIRASTLPEDARQVVVCSAILTKRPAYLVGRDQSGEPPPLPKAPFRGRIKILEVFAGNAAAGDLVDVLFGSWNHSGKRHFRPFTQNQLDRNYFVVIYLGADGERRLAGFPIEESEYQEWETELLKSEQSRTLRAAPKQ
jgi:hypothetical protein